MHFPTCRDIKVSWTSLEISTQHQQAFPWDVSFEIGREYVPVLPFSISRAYKSSHWHRSRKSSRQSEAIYRASFQTRSDHHNSGQPNSQAVGLTADLLPWSQLRQPLLPRRTRSRSPTCPRRWSRCPIGEARLVLQPPSQQVLLVKDLV